MNKFILKVTVSFIIVVLFHLVAGFFAGGNLDAYYVRFTTPRQESLIIGTSRAAQGILPSVVDSVFADKGVDLKMFNFAFTNQHSPFGRVYLNAIKQKLDKQTNNGLYIIAVDPWPLCTNNKYPDREDKFRESNSTLSKMNFFNASPNYEYLLRWYYKGWGQIILNFFQEKPTVFLHNNGWLEVSPDMDSSLVQQRTSEKLAKYREETLPKYFFSEKRLHDLERIIVFLQQHGTVVLVRIPVHHEMLGVERQLLPEFDALMASTANKHKCKYLNYSRVSDFLFTDGNHLHKSAGYEFSQKLALDILTTNPSIDE